MIRFERSFDYELIRRILTHDKIWPHISDDGSPAPDEYRPVESEAVWYILAFDDERLLGLWMLHPHNSICWEIHTCLLPNAWGERALAAGRMLPDWIWEHTPARRIVTNVPAYNRVALSYAKRTGMTPYGVNPASFLREGRLWDQVLLGISPPSRSEASGAIREEEMICQQQR